jgi:hypothetical protein
MTVLPRYSHKSTSELLTFCVMRRVRRRTGSAEPCCRSQPTLGSGFVPARRDPPPPGQFEEGWPLYLARRGVRRRECFYIWAGTLQCGPGSLAGEYDPRCRLLQLEEADRGVTSKRFALTPVGLSRLFAGRFHVSFHDLNHHVDHGVSMERCFPGQ